MKSHLILLIKASNPSNVFCQFICVQMRESWHQQVTNSNLPTKLHNPQSQPTDRVVFVRNHNQTRLFRRSEPTHCQHHRCLPILPPTCPLSLPPRQRSRRCFLLTNDYGEFLAGGTKPASRDLLLGLRLFAFSTHRFIACIAYHPNDCS